MSIHRRCNVLAILVQHTLLYSVKMQLVAVVAYSDAANSDAAIKFELNGVILDLNGKTLSSVSGC